MRLGYLVVATISAAAALPLSQAQAQVDARGLVGTWQLNTAQSRPAPGETSPASLTTRVGRMDTAHVRWATTTTNAQGETDVETFDTPGNGEFYSLNGYTMAAHRLGTDAVQSTYRDDNGQADVRPAPWAGMAAR